MIKTIAVICALLVGWVLLSWLTKPSPANGADASSVRYDNRVPNFIGKADEAYRQRKAMKLALQKAEAERLAIARSRPDPQRPQPTASQPQTVRLHRSAGSLAKNAAYDSTYRPLILSIAKRFRVPAGLLYGIWWKEGRLLKENWGKKWPLAYTLPRLDGPCVSRYGYRKCRRHWQAIRAICSQKRDGKPICNPWQVRVSYAGAMGPMQHMAGILLNCSPGRPSCRWSRHAVDYDGDGTIDPHYLPDAMASSARYLRIRYERKTCQRYRTEAKRWGCAANLYFGSLNSGYYEGKGHKVGVRSMWIAWCNHPGNC